MDTTHYLYLDDEIENLGRKSYHWAEKKHLIPSVILTNNQATSISASNPKPSSKSRHIERRYRYVTIGTERKRHILLFVKNENQLADIGTKSTSREIMTSMVRKIFVNVEPE